MTTTVENATPTPVSIGAPRGGPDQPTLRKDNWWVEPLVTFVVLVSFVAYSTWAAFVGKNYYAGADLHRDLISPFYSPCIANSCVPGSHTFGTLPFWNYSPALLILIFPLGFRLTCYYYRKAYYRSFWLSPPACAVSDAHRSYSGETRFPLILQNIHRYFFWILLLFNCILTYDAILAFRQPGYGIGISVGTARPVRQRRLPLALLAVVPRLPALLRRPGQVLRQAPDALQAVEVRHPAQRAPHALRLDQPLRRRPVRPLRAPRGERDDPRPRLSLLGLDREDRMADQTHDYETHDYDVIIIGAGGSGLRAAIEAKERGLRVALVCKSLLGKAHTVMAEGGMAAAMGNVWPEDNWQVHFRDTMRGGKMLNNWRMAQIHAQEAPDRVYELERWGALLRPHQGRPHHPA